MSTLLNQILRFPVHLIAAVRTKAEAVPADEPRPQVSDKAGTNGVHKDGPDCEFDPNRAQHMTADRARTVSFNVHPDFRPGHHVGQELQPECQIEASLPPLTASRVLIAGSVSLAALAGIHSILTPEQQAALTPDFEQRKHQLLILPFSQFSSPQPQNLPHANLSHAA